MVFYNTSQLELAKSLITLTHMELRIRSLRSIIEEYEALLHQPESTSSSGTQIDELKSELKPHQTEKAAFLGELAASYKESSLESLSHFYPPADTPLLYDHYWKLVCWVEMIRDYLIARNKEYGVLKKQRKWRNAKQEQKAIVAQQLEITSRDAAHQFLLQLDDYKVRFTAFSSTFSCMEHHLAPGPRALACIETHSKSFPDQGLLHLEKALQDVQLLKELPRSIHWSPDISLLPAEDPNLTARLAKINCGLQDLQVARKTCTTDITTLMTAIDSELMMATSSPPRSPLLQPVQIVPFDIHTTVKAAVHETFTEMRSWLDQILIHELPEDVDNNPNYLYALELVQQSLQVIAIAAHEGRTTNSDVVMQDRA
ncbi:hypothetical protein GALMADRAFT_219486 [Galerina marginata CBS 339.88]|uniref:Uncharacterized protein n=1 Tax=Galerina marginata (strain CBS 339.88) TaxID=685588 RepID=A0A067TMT9_GALM3|nr:hypothetical protein GALMADRAFT_219486 [Galerina marginata CBS 339.88]